MLRNLDSMDMGSTLCIQGHYSCRNLIDGLSKCFWMKPVEHLGLNHKILIFHSLVSCSTVTQDVSFLKALLFLAAFRSHYC